MSCSRQRKVELWKNLRKTHGGNVARNKSSNPWRKYQKPERCGKTERNTGKLHTHIKKINQQVWNAFSATDSGRKLQVVLVFVPRIWKQAHNVWREDWLLQSWLHDDQAKVTPHMFYCWMYSHFPLVQNRLITHSLDQQKVLAQRWFDCNGVMRTCTHLLLSKFEGLQ